MFVYLLAVKPKRHIFPVLSWLIRLFQRTTYSHNAIAVEGKTVIDITSKGMGIRDILDFSCDYVATEDDIKIHIDSTPEEFMNWIKIYADRPYGFMQLVGLALKVLNVTKFNPFGKEDDRLICSELIILLLARYKGLDVKDSDEYDLNRTWSIAKNYKH